MAPGYYDEVEDKASDGGDPVGHIKCECVAGLQNVVKCRLHLYELDYI